MVDLLCAVCKTYTFLKSRLFNGFLWLAVDIKHGWLTLFSASTWFLLQLLFEREQGNVVQSECVSTCRSLASKMFWQFLSSRSYNLFSSTECLILFWLWSNFLFNGFPLSGRRAAEMLPCSRWKASQCQGTSSVPHEGVSIRQKLNRSICSGGTRRGQIELGCQYHFNGVALIHWQSAIRWNNIMLLLDVLFSDLSSSCPFCTFPSICSSFLHSVERLCWRSKTFNYIHMFLKDV